MSFLQDPYCAFGPTIAARRIRRTILHVPRGTRALANLIYAVLYTKTGAEVGSFDLNDRAAQPTQERNG